VKWGKYWTAIAIIVLILIVWVLVAKGRYIIDSKYCEQDSDCVVDGDNCGAVNKYHYRESEFQCRIRTCGAGCDDNQCRLLTCPGGPPPTTTVTTTTTITITTSTTTITTPEVIITTDKAEYKQGETIIINISNSLNDDIFLPTRLTIQRLTDSTSETYYSLSKLIEVRYCCPCPNAPPIFTIHSKSHDTIEWNQTMLTYCNESTGSSVIEQTIVGNYRVMIKYSLEETSIDIFRAGSPDIYTVYSNEFTIK